MLNKIKNWLRKDEPWYLRYEKKTLSEILHEKFQNFICYLIYDKNCTWIDKLINILAMAEMYMKLDKELKEDLSNPNASYRLPDGTYTTPSIKELVPEQTFYCEGCPCAARSAVANFFYGYQSAGFCYYLNRGDFSITNPTDILWDGCKECGINEDLEEDLDEDSVLITEDLEEATQKTTQENDQVTDQETEQVTNQVKAPNEIPNKEFNNVENMSGNNSRFN